jgi:hypothetical protein
MASALVKEITVSRDTGDWIVLDSAGAHLGRFGAAAFAVAHAKEVARTTWLQGAPTRVSVCNAAGAVIVRWIYGAAALR